MEDKRLQLYLFELQTQGQMVAFGNRALDPAGPAQETWFALHAILSAAANMSKLLWGGNEQDRKDRSRLRERLGVTDDSPLRFRHVRNKFEHVDEYIDEWIEADRTAPFFGRNVGGEPPVLGDTPVRPFGHYDPDTGRLWFWEWEVSIPEIVQEGLLVGGRAGSLAMGRWVED